GALCKLSSHGELLWHHKYSYNGEPEAYLWDVKQTPDKGFFCVGTADDTIQGMWLLKLDSNGCLTPGCLVDTTDTTDTTGTAIRYIPHKLNGVSIIPNPMHDETIITVDIDQPVIYNSNQIDFSLFSIEGRKQDAEFDLSQIPHQLIIHLKRGTLDQGMYVFTITLQNQIVAKGKVVIQ